MLGFFSFTEITDPKGHREYNDWHSLDHMPEQFSLDGVLFGQRWVCTPECQEIRAAVSPQLEACHYMTLYLMSDPSVLPEFADLAERLRQEDRFFADRRAHLSGPFDVQERWAAPRVKVSAEVIPFRPSKGIYVVVGPAVDGEALVAHDGVAGAWSFAAPTSPGADPARQITVAFIDGDLAATAAELSQWCLEKPQSGRQPTEWAGPLAYLDTESCDWFDRLTPQW